MFVVLVALVAMTTIVNARGHVQSSLLFSSFSDVIFPLFHALFTENQGP